MMYLSSCRGSVSPKKRGVTITRKCGHQERAYFLSSYSINWKYEGLIYCEKCNRDRIVESRRNLLNTLGIPEQGLLHCHDAYFSKVIKNHNQRQAEIARSAVNHAA